jgi:hypothetical protein
MDSMHLVRLGLGAGVIIWAAGTALLVPFGHWVFGPDNVLPVALSAGVIIAATFAGVLLLARRVLRGTGGALIEKAALFGVLLCLPGLVFDGSLYALNSGRYPGLDATASGVMTAGLLLAYAAALLGALSAARPLGPQS